MRRSSFFVLIGFLAVVCVPVSHALAADIFSFNFESDRANDGEMANILIDEGQIAGIGDWATTGWDNFEVPWNPGPEYEGVAPMTSVAGATATFTLHEARNAGGFQTRAGTRTAPEGDANGDLMDVAAWGTWENDDTQIFDMSVSEIPFSAYDVIVYLNLHGSAGGAGTGVITFNGSAMDLVVVNFDGTTFAEIVNNGDTGNYIVYRNVEGSSFSLKLWGDGFNHLGVCGFQVREAAPERASSPYPENEATDVLRESILSWAPGEFAGTHDVYVGDSFDDVSAATIPTASGLDVTVFDAGRMAFGKTVYWRVDEVNRTPDKTVFKGEVWSFEVEPYSLLVPGDTIAVTASSESNQFSTAEQMINGSGLDANDVHGMEAGTMWYSASVDLDPWIQFEFDGVKKLDMMRVWNANSAAESAIGWSVKDVITEASVDGVTWNAVPSANQFSRGPGAANYGQYDTIGLSGAAAKYLRLNIQSNWGGLIMSYGLSEVQFFEIPVQARTPDPADGSVDIAPNAVVTWRSGREAGQHAVSISTDLNAVAEGTAPSVTTETHSLDLASLDIGLGQTYFWAVDEVNDAEAPSVWAGPVWQFTTVEAVVVDDFDSYGNASPNRPFQTWLDGFGYSADDFFTQGYGGNGTGAGIGHDIWSLSSPYFDGSIMETDRTIAGSNRSMPFYYINTGGASSETQRTFTPAQDWTVGGVQLLSIAFLGEADNTGTLYTKINGTKVTYTLEPTDIAAQSWKTWNIDLATLGINLQSITSMAIGVEGSSASGMLLIDDIVLRSAPSAPTESVSLINNFDLLPVGSNMHDVSGWEGWFGDAQWGARVTDTVAYSGTNSLEIVGTRDDLVPNWPRVESGVYVSSVMQYVPTGTDGSMYFGLLSDYGVNGDKLAWLGTVLSNCTTGMVYVNELDAGTRTETPLLRDQWVQIKIVMNFGGNTCDFYYGDVLLGSRECPSAGGYDIWPDENVDVVYYDDFRFQSEVEYLRGMPGNVPNGDFELLYKTGTEIAGVVAGGAWSMGVGPDCPIDGGTGYEFSDGTTGENADIPGWVGYDQTGWIADGGTYDRDTTNVDFQGNISFVGGNQFFGANGGGWGNPAGGLITSAASLGIVGDATYVLSMTARAPDGAATPVVLDLLADGVVLTPTSSVDPALTGEWQEVSRTYDAASLAGVLGQDLTIVLGVGRGASGAQSHVDDISLYIR